MSSNINSNTLTKEQLFACLEHDGIAVDVNIVNKAKNNDGEALRDTSYEYKGKKQDYPKAMAWYQLAANQNNSDVYSRIGVLYFYGLGVPQDYLTAMEYYLKAARDNRIFVMSIVAFLFLNGYGVPVDKYKALEWYTKSGKEPDVKKVNQEGIHLREEDKNKTIYQLANEAGGVLREVRMERESKLREELELLREECQTKSQQIQQQLEEEDNIIALLQDLVQSKTNLIHLLQRNNQ